MSDFWGDVRFGLRLLARSPVFALTVSLLLGIGIGANTLIFSVIDSLLLRPLPVKQAEQLVRLIEVHPTGFITWDLPLALYEQLAAHASTLTDVLCQGDLDVAFEDGAAIERIRVNAVSRDFFSALGIQARLGRVLTADDDRAGLMLAVVSYDFWQRRLAASTSIIGRNIRLNGRAFTVVGVLPKGVNGLNVDTSPDIRIPLTAGRLLVQTPGIDPDSRLLLRFQIFGRLRPGITLERAETEIEPLLRGPYEDALIRAFPELAKAPRKDLFDSRLRLEPAGKGVSSLRAQFSRGLVLLMACVGLLLLMACANVACLLLARSAARSQEIGIRLMLGANPWRVARQLLTESLVLSLSGGAVGVLLTYICKPLLLAALPPIRDRAAVVQPLAVHVDIDLRVLGFAILASLATALLFGLWPAVRGARQDLAGFIRGGRSTTARLSARNILVVAQVAVCVLLLAGASVLVETFHRMRLMNAGFDRDHIVTFTIDPGLKGYKPERARLLSRKLLEKTRSLPGVIAAGIASRGLMRGTGVKATFGVAGEPISRNDFLNSSLNSVTPDYFDAMGMRVVAGRDFTWSDDNQQKPRKVIVNQAFVRRFFPGQSALGRLFGNRGPDGLAAADNQIIGVVSDAKYRSLREEIPPTVYSPVVSGFDSSFILHLRTRGQPASVIAPVREALRSLDAELPFIEVRTLREEVETSLWQERLLAGLCTIFSCFAALLAGIGLYGALDFAVKARTREIGVRVALGADPLRVIQLLSSETLLLVTAGAALGLAVYAASARSIRHVLYGVDPSDHLALASALLFIAAVALGATAPPIWRAARMDPASALRHE
jgi:predicted permease